MCTDFFSSLYYFILIILIRLEMKKVEALYLGWMFWMFSGWELHYISLKSVLQVMAQM